MKKTLLTLFALMFSINFASAIEMIIPVSVGNGTDNVGRILAYELEQKLKENIIVINKPGASTSIGTRYVIDAKPDGQTILFTSAATLSAKHVLKSINYNIDVDLIPITTIAETPMVLVTNKKFNSLNYLINYGKTNELKYGIIGYGGTTHFISELFIKESKIKTHEVPYKGTQDSLIDIIAERIDFVFIPIQAAKSFYKNKDVNILGVALNKRLTSYPEIKTMDEQGFSKVYLNFWTGVFVPKNTPKDHINKLITAINEIKNKEEFKNKLLEMGVLVTKNINNDEFVNFIQNENIFYENLMRQTNIKPQ